MNIGFYIFSMNKGGAERVVANLANYFDRQGDHVTLFLISDNELMYKLNENIEIRYLPQKQRNGFGLGKIVYNIKLIRALRKHLKDTKCEALLCMSAGHVSRAVLAGKGVTRVIGLERANPYRAYDKKQLFLNRIAYRLSDGYVFQTMEAKRCYGNKGSIIGNPVMAETNNIIWSDRKKNAFCAVGRLVDVKNYPHMIRMFEKLHQSDSSFTLDIYGIGDREAELRRMIDEINGGEYIRLKGNADRVCDCLVKYPFFLMCSKYEGMPNALIEAMLCGCVCFSTDFNFGPAELMKNGVNGFIIPENHVEALTDRMKEVVDSGISFDRISENAIDTIKSNYNISYIGKKYRNYIAEVVKGPTV